LAAKVFAITNSLGKNKRLKSRKLIALLFSEGKAMSVFPLRLLYLTTDQPLLLQAAFSVSSRAFKSAVDRNRIKRIMREAYRIRKQPLENNLKKSSSNMLLFFNYTGKELEATQSIATSMEEIVSRLVRVVEKEGR
jgi:ribonuclease P protein component